MKQERAVGGPVARSSVTVRALRSLPTTQPGDARERDADRMARDAMRGADDVVRAGGGSAHVGAMPGPERRFFEGRFGHEFSQIRIHADDDAARTAAAVGARAFTVGQDLYFGAGQYQPGSSSGRRLIAHELAHAVQQGDAPPALARVSWGEKWDAFWSAGPIDARRAKKLADEALARAQVVGREMGLPRSALHNGPPDAWRHCYWNCRMTEVIGEEDAKDIADGHEANGDNDVAERMMDLWNNEEGRACSGDCDTCCQGKLDAGNLWVIDPTDGKVMKSFRVPRTGAGAAEGGEYQKGYTY